MLNLLASHPLDPLETINLYYHEVSGIWIALASLCMVACAVYQVLKKRPSNSEAS